jgi:hypothetical protein
MFLKDCKVICVSPDTDSKNPLLEEGKEYLASNATTRGMEHKFSLNLVNEGKGHPYVDLYRFEIESTTYLTDVHYGELRLPIIMETSTLTNLGEEVAYLTLSPYGRLYEVAKSDATSFGAFDKPQRLSCEAITYFQLPSHA